MDTFDGKADESKPGFLRRCVPILGWLASYNRNWSAGHAVAGLSVWALLTPQALVCVASVRRQPPPAAALHRCHLCYDDSVVPVEAEPLDWAYGICGCAAGSVGRIAT